MSAMMKNPPSGTPATSPACRSPAGCGSAVVNDGAKQTSEEVAFARVLCAQPVVEAGMALVWQIRPLQRLGNGLLPAA